MDATVSFNEKTSSYLNKIYQQQSQCHLMAFVSPEEKAINCDWSSNCFCSFRNRRIGEQSAGLYRHLCVTAPRRRPVFE